MTDKTQKFLAKLSAKELDFIKIVLDNVKQGSLVGLNIKHIKGKKDYYRVRVGRVRIIYRKTSRGNEIMHVTNRNEKTYRDF